MNMSRFEHWMSRRLIGFPQDVLRVFAAELLAGRNALFIGRHGIGKTTVFKCLAESLGEGGDWVVYDMSKDDLVSIAGIPDASAMARGELRFAKHERSIFGKRFVLLDECTRASKETQNILLEILEEQRLFGIPLEYEVLVATCNPDSYAATFRLDQALLDRFPVVFPLSDFQDSDSQTISDIARANLRPRAQHAAHFESAPHIDLEESRRQMLALRAQLQHDAKLIDAITGWCGALVNMLLSRPEGQEYISARTFGAHLPNVLLDVMAYEGMCRETCDGNLERQAEWAARFALQTKCNLDVSDFNSALRVARRHLAAYEKSIQNDVLYDVSHGTLQERIEAMEKLPQDLSSEDRQRLDTLVRQMYSETVLHEEQQVPLLWKACGNQQLAAICRDIESSVLKSRLKYLANVPQMVAEGYGVRLLDASRALSSRKDNWKPSAERWESQT